MIFLASNHNNPLSDQSAIYVAALDDPRPRVLLPTYGSTQAVPGWLLFVQATSLMAQRFDARKLALIGDPVPVAASVYYDTGVWRGGFSASQNGAVVYQPFSFSQITGGFKHSSMVVQIEKLGANS